MTGIESRVGPRAGLGGRVYSCSRNSGSGRFYSQPRRQGLFAESYGERAARSFALGFAALKFDVDETTAGIARRGTGRLRREMRGWSSAFARRPRRVGPNVDLAIGMPGRTTSPRIRGAAMEPFNCCGWRRPCRRERRRAAEVSGRAVPLAGENLTCLGFPRPAGGPGAPMPPPKCGGSPLPQARENREVYYGRWRPHNVSGPGTTHRRTLARRIPPFCDECTGSLPRLGRSDDPGHGIQDGHVCDRQTWGSGPRSTTRSRGIPAPRTRSSASAVGTPDGCGCLP